MTPAEILCERLSGVVRALQREDDRMLASIAENMDEAVAMIAWQGEEIVRLYGLLFEIERVAKQQLDSKPFFYARRPHPASRFQHLIDEQAKGPTPK